MTTTITKCGSCQASIVFGVTIDGKRIPIDAQPNQRGNIVSVTNPDDDGTWIVAVSSPPTQEETLFGESDDRTRWMPHFESCPNADQHRGNR